MEYQETGLGVCLAMLSIRIPLRSISTVTEKTTLAYYRPSVSEWWILKSTDGIKAVQFGQAGDKAIAGDYTGDGKTDVAFFRPSSGQWFILRSEDNSYYGFPFGSNGDVPTPGDYDGDGKFDAAVFRLRVRSGICKGL